MASSTPSAATCGICLDLFDDPRMLECLHSFCCKCLKKKSLATCVTCPACKTVTSLKSGGVNALPMDLRRSYEAEVAQYAKRIQSKEESCDQCIDVSNGPAISFCMECSEFLCKSCTMHHKTWRKTLNHELQPVGGEQLDLKALRVPHKPMNCQLHEDETIKFYCEKCSALICRDCRDLHHKGHNVDRVEQMAEKQKVALQSSSRNVDKAKTSAISDGNNVIQRIQGKQKSIEQDIDSTFEALDKALQMRKKALLAKTAEISFAKQGVLKTQGEKLKTLRKELDELSGMITKATQVYTPVEMLSARGAITNRLQLLIKKFQSLNLQPCKSDIMPSVLDTSELAGKISSFGLVLGGSYPGEAKTDLHIPRAITGKQKSVTITTCDIQGRPFPFGNERVEVTLSLLGSNNHPMRATVVDNKNGTYTASFVPQGKGKHQLSICIDSHHIKGSPIPMYVREARDYTKVSCSPQKVFIASSNIIDVAVDDKGNVYLIVCGNSTVEVFDKNGDRIHKIGTKGTENGQLNNPSAIAIRGSVLYIVDRGNHRVQMLSTSGGFISKFGTPDSGEGKLTNPRGICLDREGRIFISDGSSNCVSVFEANGTFLYHIVGTNESKLNCPWGLAFDQCGNLHVADTKTNAIKVFTPQGQYISQYNSGVNHPSGIAIDDEGNSFIAQYNYLQENNNQSLLSILNAQHKVISTIKTAKYGAGIIVDNKGSIFLCSSSDCCVSKY